MENHVIKDLLETSMYKIQDMINVNTIIGETIYAPNGTTIIPISKVCFGFAAGGSDFKHEVVKEYEKQEKNETIKTINPFGGGAGAGVKIDPVGFLIVESNCTTCPRFIPVEYDSTIDKIIDYVPEILKKIENLTGKNNKVREEENQNLEEEYNITTDNGIEKEYYKNEIPTESDGEEF